MKKKRKQIHQNKKTPCGSLSFFRRKKVKFHRVPQMCSTNSRYTSAQKPLTLPNAPSFPLLPLKLCGKCGAQVPRTHITSQGHTQQNRIAQKYFCVVRFGLLPQEANHTNISHIRTHTAEPNCTKYAYFV